MGDHPLPSRGLADVPRVLLISHEPIGEPGLVGRILVERGCETELHVVLADPEHPNVDYPDPQQFDAVIAFGSFSSAYDPAARPWVEPEVDLIRRMLADDLPYLGVCFGGQLLAEALGGTVEAAPSGHDEIGLVTFDEADGVPAGPWVTWHGDRVTLPPDVDVLARNDHAIQVFRKGRAAGTQFHPEADTAIFTTWATIGADHIPAGRDGATLISDVAASEAALRANCEALVDWFLAEVAGVSAAS